MADEAADDRIARPLGGALHGRRDVPDAVACPRLLDARIQRRAAGLQELLGLGRISPTANVHAESATKPPSVTPTSTETTSPAARVYSPGIPCTTIEFGETQIDADIPGTP